VLALSPHRREPVITDVITYVGIEAHKKDLFIAVLLGNQATPVTWNEPNAVRRLAKKLEREAPGPVIPYCCLQRSRPALYGGSARHRAATLKQQ
jgi:hypothetical protein